MTSIEKKNIDLKLSITISLLGLLATCYLWTYVSTGNHWELFGTHTEKFLTGYGIQLALFFSGVLGLPLIIKRDKKRLLVALMSIPVFTFINYSLITFLD